MRNNEEDWSAPKLYKRRWAFLAAIVVSVQTIRVYSVMSPGQVSNVYVTYFNVTYEQVDWFSEVSYLVQTLTSPFLAWLSYSKMIDTRRACLAATGFVATGYLFRAISLTHHHLYSLMLIGQIFQGLAKTISASLPATFAVLWFPPSQVGTAIAANFVGMSVGSFMAGAIPPRVLKNPDQYLLQRNFTRSKNYTENTIKNNVSVLLKISLSFFVVAIAIFVFLAIFLNDGPPTPPSQSEEMKDQVRGNSKPDFRQFLTDTKRLICDYTFVFISLAYGLQLHVFIVEIIMMSQLIHSAIKFFHSKVNSYTVGGDVIIICAASTICGAFVAGQLIDKIRGYLMIAKLAAFLSTLSSIGIFLGYYYSSVVGIYIGVFGYGLCECVVLITVYQVIAQHTYPMDEIFTACWLGTLQGWLAPAIGQLARVLFSKLGGEKMLIIVQTGGLLVSSLLLFLIKPKYKRREADERDSDDNVHESSPLFDVDEENISESVIANEQ